MSDSLRLIWDSCIRIVDRCSDCRVDRVAWFVPGRIDRRSMVDVALGCRWCGGTGAGHSVQAAAARAGRNYPRTEEAVFHGERDIRADFGTGGRPRAAVWSGKPVERLVLGGSEPCGDYLRRIGKLFVVKHARDLDSLTAS